MKRLALVLLLLVSGLVLVLPISAAPPAPIGDKINIGWHPPAQFSPDTPFHIEHGHVLGRSDRPFGKFGFSLTLDGQPVAPSYKTVTTLHDYTSPNGTYFPWAMRRTNVYNFGEGLASGAHTFLGEWTGPCQWAVENVGYPGPCASKHAPVVFDTATATIEFVTE